MVSKKLLAIIMLLALSGFISGKLYTYYRSSKDKASYRRMQEDLAQQMVAGIFQNDETGIAMPYRLFVPPDYQKYPEKQFPIIIAFHSGRGRGNDNFTQLD